jgi:5'-AMP-activated protein kinase, catalytic alpha subunit
MNSKVIRIGNHLKKNKKKGNYRLGKTIGEGSFGKVKLAEHELTSHKVAVKIVNKEKLKDSKVNNKIKREIKILKLLKHRKKKH